MNSSGRLRVFLSVFGGLALVVAVGAWRWADSTSSTPNGEVSTAVVTKIVDGDTIEVEIGGQTERVRLLGVDTPESVAPNTPKQCYGLEATNALRGILSPGDTIEVAADIERRDRYGRLLLFVYTEDGLLINSWLLQSGFADILFIEPNVAFRSEFTDYRNQARELGIGLWGACDGPDQPLD